MVRVFDPMNSDWDLRIDIIGFHEAGHAIVAICLNCKFKEIVFEYDDSTETFGKCCVTLGGHDYGEIVSDDKMPPSEKIRMIKDEFDKKICVALAGEVAIQVIFPCRTEAMDNIFFSLAEKDYPEIDKLTEERKDLIKVIHEYHGLDMTGPDEEDLLNEDQIKKKCHSILEPRKEIIKSLKDIVIRQRVTPYKQARDHVLSSLKPDQTA